MRRNGKLRKLLSLSLALLFVLALLPGTALAATAASGAFGAEGDNLTWALDDSGKLTISGSGAMPNFNDDQPWVNYRDKITSVLIEPGVTEIGDGAFVYCYNLSELTMPYTLTRIGSHAFLCCALTEVEIPASVTDIGFGAFAYCRAVTKYTVEIGNTAYYSNSSGALYTYDRRTLIAWPAANETVTDLNFGIINTIEVYAFANAVHLKSVRLPEGISVIPFAAFNSCSAMTSIYLPSTLTEIGNYAFIGCSALTDIYFGGSREQWQAITMGEDNDDLLRNSIVHFSDDLYEIPDTDLTWTLSNGVLTVRGTGAMPDFSYNSLQEFPPWDWLDSKINNVILESGVTSVGACAFSNCSNLSNAVLPDGLQRIGKWAFEACPILPSIRIPQTVTEIEDGAFAACVGLDSVVVEDGNSYYHSSGNCIIETAGKRLILGSADGAIPADGSVTVIGAQAYNRRTSLTSVSIPRTVTRIENYAFYYCSGLTGVTIPGSVTSIGFAAFEYCSGLTDVTIPSSVTSIGDWAFSHCTSLTDVIIPGSVTSIANYTFTDCTSLTRVTIPSSVTSIGEFAFRACYDLAGITIPNSVTSIGTGAFLVCGLTSITIPGSITSIANSTFAGCSNLTSVTIPKSVTCIGGYAFQVCNALTDVYYGGTAEDWNKVEVNEYNESLQNATFHFAEAPTVSSVKANKTSAATGETITWTATASGGSGTLQYYFILYKDGTKIKTRDYSTSRTFSYTPAEAGSYKVKVYVKDAADTKANKTSTGVTVTEAAAALAISSVKADKTTAATGETITWTAAASGGSGTLKYYFILYKDGTKVKTRAYSTSKTFSYTPTETGTYKVKVYVKDAVDTKVNKTSTGVTVTSAAPTITSVKASVTSAYAGEKITWTAAASGGSGTLKYYFILYKDGKKIKTRSYSTTKTFSYTPTEAGNYKVKVYVKDSAGAKSYKTGGKVAVTLGPLAIVSVKAGKTSSAVGEKITWTAAAAGSEQPLKYYFILYKDGVKIKTRSYSTVNTFSYTPTEAGVYKVKVYVKDAEGTKVYKSSAKLTVS